MPGFKKQSIGLALHYLNTDSLLKTHDQNRCSRTRDIAYITHNASFHWVTSLGAIDQMTASFLECHEKLFSHMQCHSARSVNTLKCVKLVKLPFKYTFISMLRQTFMALRVIFLNMLSPWKQLPQSHRDSSLQTVKTAVWLHAFCWEVVNVDIVVTFMHDYKPQQKSTRSCACLLQHTIGKTTVVLAMRCKRCTSAWSAADMFL